MDNPGAHPAPLPFDEAAIAELSRIEGTGRREVTGVEGGRLVWRVWGAGPPLLLLHGGTGAWSHWIRNVEPLSALYTVIVVDIPGHGESDPVGEDPARVAAALWQGLDTVLGGPAPVLIVGFSFGGAIGGQMARARPRQVERLVLVGSGGMRLTRPETEPLTKWRKLTDPDEVLQAHRSNLKALMFHDPSRVDELALLLQATNTRAARIKSRNISRAIDLGVLLDGCPVPLAGIWGAHDATARGFIDERKAFIRHLDPHAEFHLIEDAGHWVQYEAAAEFNRILLGILNVRRFRARDAGPREATLQQGEKPMSAAFSEGLGAAIDDAAIRTVISRYFYALDARDRSVLETVFAEDVEVQYHTGTVGQFVQNGAANIVNYLIDNMGNYKVRTHVGANTQVWLDGDAATTVTNAVATLLKGERLVVRGLRYSDEFARIGKEWRIRRRKHLPLWQYVAAPSEPDVPAPALKLAAAQAGAG